MKKILDYFDETIEFGGHTVIDNLLSFNTFYEYINVDFLNGLINYVKPIAIYQLDRYCKEDKIMTGDGEFGCTKSELRTFILSGEIDFSNLSVFEDDIIVLGKSENDENIYIYFYFDFDISDCQIGRIYSEDSDNILKDSIVNYLDERVEENKGRKVEDNMECGIISYCELPLSCLRGWLKY